MRLTFLSRFAIPLALLLLCLMAMHPFLLDKMILTDDGTLHLYRVIALDYSLIYDDALYPRYSSGLVYGYGAPLFNYYSPASYILPRFLHVFGMSFIQAWLISMAVYIYLAAAGAYLAGKLWTNRVGGFITAAAYMYAPYMLFDTVSRGTSAEVAGLAFLPMVLYGFHRLALYGRRSDFLLATLSYAAFILMHNVLTLHGTAFIGVYCLLLLWITSHKKRAFSQILVAGMLALILTAFFWMPALLETDFVKINGVTENLDFIAIKNSLRPLNDVLALPRTADPTQLQAPVPITIHWIVLLLSLSALWFARKHQQLRTITFFLLMVTGFLLFLNTEASLFLWETVPLLDYSQFAWRVLGIASLTLALAGGIAAGLIVEQIRSQRTRIVFCGVLVAGLMLYSIPWLYTLYSAPEANSIVDLQNYERETRQLALSSYTEYLPATTDETYLNPEKLQIAFDESIPISRLSLPDGMTLIDAEWSGTSAELHLIADNPTMLIFDWLHVPGWQAVLSDGTVLDVNPTQPEGLVSIEIPAGEHQLNVWLGRTQTQQTAELLSIAGLLVLIVILVMGWRFWRSSSNGENAAQNQHWLIYTVSIVTVAVFLFKAGYVDNTQNLFRQERFADGIEAGVENSLNANFSDLIALYYSAPKSIQTGSEGDIRLYMGLSNNVIDTDYSTLVTLRNSTGVNVFEAGSFMPGGRATSGWIPGTYIEDIITLDIPSILPPVTYTLEIALYDAENGQRLNVMNAAGNPEDVKIVAGTIEVIRGDNSMSGEALSDDNLTLFAPDDIEAVIGIPVQAQVGGEITLSWTWIAQQALKENLQARLIWLDDDNQIAAMSSELEITPGFDISQWQPGDIWQGANRLFVPGSLDTGDYTVAIQVVDETGNAAGDNLRLQEMTITTPERTYDMPEIATEMDFAWENGIRLQGYTIDGNLVNLVWSTDRQLDASLRVFMHVLDDEQIMSISDGIPADWVRPTTGWQPGEFIITTHVFDDVPSGTYDLRIGWYDPITANRVIMESGEDALFLPQIFEITE